MALKSENIKFEYGKTFKLSELPPNSIALDGSVQGPEVDNANRRYSFDHHANCLRFATLATCQQVSLAVEMGLVVDEYTNVYCNDIDADTVLAVWLLEHPERVREAKVIELVEKVGRMDAHFMGPAAPVHYMLAPPRGTTVQTEEMVGECLAVLDKWYDGSLMTPPARKSAGKAFGWKAGEGWQDLGEVEDGFNDLYGAGFTAGIVYSPAQAGTMLYTVGRRSDFVPVQTGPSHVNRQTDPASYRQDTLLGQLALAEIEKNPGQDHNTNWGGSSTVGGSCRNPGNVGSVLTPAEVLEICKRFGA